MDFSFWHAIIRLDPILILCENGSISPSLRCLSKKSVTPKAARKAITMLAIHVSSVANFNHSAW